MLITFTEFMSGESVAINPNKVVSVFTVQDDGNAESKKFIGRTAILLGTATIIVFESYLEVVGKINGELQ